MKFEKIPLPEPSERFVQKVMAGVREAEREKFRWFDWWRIPALGLGLAAVVFFSLVAIETYQDGSDSVLLAGSDEASLDDVVRFAFEEDTGGAL